MGMERGIGGNSDQASVVETRRDQGREFFEGGASVVSNEGGARLEVTPDQIETSRAEMEQDLAARAEREVQDKQKVEKMLDSLEGSYEEKAVEQQIQPESVMEQQDDRDGAEKRIREINVWNREAPERKESQKRKAQIAAIGGAGIAGIAGVGTLLAAPGAFAGSVAAGVVGASLAWAWAVPAVAAGAWYGWKRFQESRKEKKLFNEEFNLRKRHGLG